MSKTLLYGLLGFGKVPKRHAPALREEGIVLIDEAVSGSVTFKRFKAPGRRHSWKKSWFLGCLVLTQQTFAAFAMTRPLVYVPLDDPRRAKLRCSVEEGDTLAISYDASLLDERRSGTVECRFRTAKAQLFLEQLVRGTTKVRVSSQ
jgi:hypothetical protein